MRDHLLAGAPEHQSGQFSQAARPHNDHIAATYLCHFDNGFRRAPLDMLDNRLARDLPHRIQGMLQDLLRLVEPGIDRLLHVGLAQVRRDGLIGIYNPQGL